MCGIATLLLTRFSVLFAVGKKTHGGGKGKSRGGGYSTVVSEPKFKPEDDGELVKTSAQWNGLRGLRNLGNTCFFNSIVQNLVQTVPLRAHLVPRDPFSPTEAANRPKAGEAAVSAALRSVLVQMWLGASHTYDPTVLFSAIESKVARFRGKQQQDAHELLRFLMDHIDTEILGFLKVFKRDYLGKPIPLPSAQHSKVEEQEGQKGEPTNDGAPDAHTPNTSDDPPQERPLATIDFLLKRQAGNLVPNESYNQSVYETREKSGLVSYMESIFGGKIESTLMCHSCGHCSSTYESFMDLSIPIPIRFLDEKMKRALGLIPSHKNVHQSSKGATHTNAQEKKGNTSKSGHPSAVDHEDENPEDRMEFKSNYDYETLSTMGGSGNSKKTIGSLNSQSSSSSHLSHAHAHTKASARAKVMAKIQAKLQQHQQAEQEATSSKPARKLGKRDKKREQLKKDAESHSLEISVDLSGLTDEEIMKLALEDDEEVQAVLDSLVKSSCHSHSHSSDTASTDTSTTSLSALDPNENQTDALLANVEQVTSSPDEATIDHHFEENIGEQLQSEANQEESRSKQNLLEENAEDETTTANAAPSVAEASSVAPITEQSKGDEIAEQTSSTAQEEHAKSEETHNPTPVASNGSTAPTIEKQSVESPIAEPETRIVPASTISEEVKMVDDSSNASTVPAQPPVEPSRANSNVNTSANGISNATEKALLETVKLNPLLKHDVRTISRPAHLSIDACLYEFTEPEILVGSNAVGCYECTKRSFLAQGRDVTQLILEYGTDEEKAKLNVTESSIAPVTVVSAPKEEEKLSLDSSAPVDVPSASVGPPPVETSSIVVDNAVPVENVVEKKEVAVEEEKAEDDASSGSDSSDDETSEVVKPVEKSEGELAVEQEKREAKEAKERSAAEKSIPLVRTVATKQILIDELPTILTLHLKRFWQTLSGCAKLDHKVEFPTVLNLAPYLSRSARKRYSKSNRNGQEDEETGEVKKPKRPLDVDSIRYQLYGIVVHSGSMSGGHYVAYTRRRENPISDATSLEEIKNGWHYISDSSVCNATLDQVLMQQAYILFYERIVE